jgi:D-3-phosphoglycerate dehydrogenase
LISLLQQDSYDLIYKRSRVPITARVLDAAPSVSAIMLCCIGDDSVDKEACAKRGVLVLNDPVSNARSVVELFVGAMIGMSRRMFEAVAETNDSQFLKSQSQRYEVRGKVLGVFGLGNIGKQVAQVGESLGMRVVFYDNRDVAREVGETMGWTYLPDLTTLFRESDVVTCHISAADYRGDSNDQIIRAEHFAAMGERAKSSPRLFVNLARGNIFAADDLVAAVEADHVSRAMVDVYPDEPKSADEAWPNPYAGNPRIFGTPHIGAATLEAQPRIAAHVARSTKHLSHGGRLRNCVMAPKVEIGLDQVSDFDHILTVVHSNRRGTKKAVDDAIFHAGASNLTSAHRDFAAYGIAYEVVAIDKPLTDAQLQGLVDEAAEISGDPHAVRALRQISKR